jgi:hypothetical protein
MREYGFKYYGMAKPVSISQINRTLRELRDVGLSVSESRIGDPIGQNRLPQRVNYGQLEADVNRNKLMSEVNDLCRIARKAHGTFFFSKDSYFEKPMNDE